DLDRAVGQWRVAGSEDEVVLHIVAEFGFESCAHVYFGEDPEALLGERRARAYHGVVEAGGDSRGQAEAGFGGHEQTRFPGYRISGEGFSRLGPRRLRCRPVDRAEP